MKNTKCILFDCMETLIDMTELPKFEDYALWAYHGAELEDYWKDFHEFLEEYIYSKDIIEKFITSSKEYDLSEIFKIMAKRKTKDNFLIEYILKKLMNNYWKNYKDKCYVRSDVSKTLHKLSDKYDLGIVSNFKVKSGVEDLLNSTSIAHYFKNIVVSINVGWRKPNENIYKTALDYFKFKPKEVLFVGDDYINDYVQPRKLGLNSIILDRYNKYKYIKHRISNFYELEYYIK
jgi:putative hydrolase of the HAD superfamily